jgi:hypothetical protein
MYNLNYIKLKEGGDQPIKEEGGNTRLFGVKFCCVIFICTGKKFYKIHKSVLRPNEIKQK